MGLDIYTYRTRNIEEYKRVEELKQQVDAKATEVWQTLDNGRDYNALPETERERISDEANKQAKELAKELGLEVPEDKSYWDIENPYAERYNETPKTHPEHSLFTLGYFRSSYNSGGINHILEDRIGITLYDIFGYDDDAESDFVPDWESVKDKALKAKHDLIDAYNKSGNVGILAVSGYNREQMPTDEAEALAIFQKQFDDHSKNNDKRMFSAYSNGQGYFDFSEDAMRVKAVIPGVSKYGLIESVSYVVYEMSEDTAQFYLDALDIIAETAGVAMSDKEHTYFLSWSA